MVRVEALCQVMRAGGDPALAVIDFAEFSSQGTIADLISRDFPGRRIVRIDAVSALGADLRHLDLEELAGACARGLHRVAPALIVGYCSAAALAVRTAAALDEAGQHPSVVLVEPTWVTAEHLRTALGGLRGSLNAPDTYPGTLDLPTVLAVLRQDLTRNLRAQGVPEHELVACIELLLPRYEAWFSFLDLMQRGGAGPADYEDVCVIIGQASPVRDQDVATTTVRRLSIETSDVRRSEMTSAAIRDVLAAAYARRA